MRLKEIMQKTGLTKRTIHFYIEEHFLTPDVDPSNGYYIFSDEDVERLKILQQLRKADFSIKDIHAILKHPTSAYIYIKKQMEKLQQEQELLTRKIGSLQRLYDKLPVLVSSEDFSDAVFRTDFPDNTFALPPNLNSDVNLISLYLWSPFLNGITMSEYQKYLWDKLLRETAKVPSDTLLTLKDYLYSLSAEQLDRELRLRTRHIEEVASLTPEKMPLYVEKACEWITGCSQNDAFAASWKQDYHSHTQPLTQLYDSDFNSLMTELSPRFSDYYRNIHICCDRIYDWLLSPEGSPIFTRLSEQLGGYMDFCALHHGEIAALFGIGISRDSITSV